MAAKVFWNDVRGEYEITFDDGVRVTVHGDHTAAVNEMVRGREVAGDARLAARELRDAVRRLNDAVTTMRLSADSVELFADGLTKPRPEDS